MHVHWCKFAYFVWTYTYRTDSASGLMFFQWSIFKRCYALPQNKRFMVPLVACAPSPAQACPRDLLSLSCKFRAPAATFEPVWVSWSPSDAYHLARCCATGASGSFFFIRQCLCSPIRRSSSRKIQSLTCIEGCSALAPFAAGLLSGSRWIFSCSTL